MRKTVFAHERIAAEASRRLTHLGIPLDFSPASLAGVDSYLGVLLPSGELDAHEASSELDDQILLFGSYVGETFRRRLGGDWNDPGSGADLASRIQLILPSGEVCHPLQPVRERLLQFAPPGLHCLEIFDQLRDRLQQGNDTPQEAPSWARFAAILLGIGMCVSQTRAVLEGVFGDTGAFVRTPKKGDAPRAKRYAAAVETVADLAWKQAQSTGLR